MQDTENSVDPGSGSDTSDFLTVANRLTALSLTQQTCPDFLSIVLTEVLRATGGKRAFLATIEQESGEMSVHKAAGEGWTEENQKVRLRPHNETERGITGYVAITGEPYLCHDVRTDPHYIPYFADVLSEVAVPFQDSEGRVRGVLSVDSDRLHAFQPYHIVLLTTFANSVASALAFEEYRKRERLLVEIGMDLASTTDTSLLANRVVNVAAKALRCDACSVFLLDDASELLVLKASRGALSKKVGTATYRLGEGLTGTVGQTGETLRLDDPRDDPRWKGRYAEFSPDELSAFLAVPIPGRETILGVVRVSRPRHAPAWFRGRFTESDQRVLQTIASQLGNAVENARSFTRLVRSERMAAWGELSAKSAHMIGNRTFAIKGDLNELKYLLAQCTSDTQLMDPRMCEEVTELVQNIERGVFKLEDILREFRDFVMATELTLEDTDINALVRETVRETFPKRTPVRLEEHYAEALPLVRCDGGKLKRGFSELIENAVSFMPDGGTLTVETVVIAPGQGPQFVRLSPRRRYVCITFSDTGPGVPQDVKERIFRPFFSSRVKGMGLGLSIVKGIVDAHHGAVRETGTPGKSARFQIYLPVERA